MYLNGGDLYAWREAGLPVRLTRSGGVAEAHLSPDGRFVAYLLQSEGVRLELWVAGLDGSPPRRLLTSLQIQEMVRSKLDKTAVAVDPHPFDWTPDGKRIAFGLRQALDSGETVSFGDLYTLDPTDGLTTTLKTPGPPARYIFAPNGRSIAQVTASSAGVLNPDGSPRAPDGLAFPPITPYTGGPYLPEPAWRTDSSGYLLAVPPPDPLADPSARTTVWLVPADGSTARKISEILAAPYIDAPLAFSSDGSRFAYLSETSTGKRELHWMDLTGKDVKYAEAAPLHFLGWADPPTRFAYQAGQAGEIWLGQEDRPPIMLQDGKGSVLFVRWVSADRYLFLQKTGDGFELKLGAPGAAPTLIGRVDSPNSPIDAAWVQP
jgi:Tol biopolymer transport system component